MSCNESLRVALQRASHLVSIFPQAGAHEMIPTLMLYGALAAIDTRNNFRHSALHNAVHGRHVQATRALLEFGANPCLRFDGISVLDLAAETGHQGLMRLLSAACSKWADERGWEDESGDEDDEVQGEDEDAERSEDSADVEPSVDESCASDNDDESDAEPESRKQARLNLASYRQAMLGLR